MESLFSLRNNKTGTFELFVEHMVCAVVGKQIFKTRVHKSLLSSFSTVSDKAYALILLENSYDQWLDMHNKQNLKTSNVMPKYTNAGQTKYHDNGSSNQQFKGWSIDGL